MNSNNELDEFTDFEEIVYGFQGRRLDSETDGLMYFRNRHYSSKLGRWLQRDPLGYIDSLGLYEAFGGNSYSFSDPMGLERFYKGDIQAAPKRAKQARQWVEEQKVLQELLFLLDVAKGIAENSPQWSGYPEIVDNHCQRYTPVLGLPLSTPGHQFFIYGIHSVDIGTSIAIALSPLGDIRDLFYGLQGIYNQPYNLGAYGAFTFASLGLFSGPMDNVAYAFVPNIYNSLYRAPTYVRNKVLGISSSKRKLIDNMKKMQTLDVGEVKLGFLISSSSKYGKYIDINITNATKVDILEEYVHAIVFRNQSTYPAFLKTLERVRDTIPTVDNFATANEIFTKTFLLKNADALGFNAWDKLYLSTQLRRLNKYGIDNGY